MIVHERVHTQIQAFLARNAVNTSLSKPAELSDGAYNKAGVIPYIAGKNMRFCMMKPIPTRPGLGAPAFQICKGTRMRYASGEGWKDMPSGVICDGIKETLVTTALREGVEELGLIPEKLGNILDVGAYNFSSSLSGSGKAMWLYAVQMQSEADLLPMNEVAQTTSDRGWLTLDEFMVVGREDHRYILSDIAAKIMSFRQE